jgi:hypothetical protein
MSYYSTKTQKYYIRICLDTKNLTSFQTMGPYTEKEAIKLSLERLSTGICCWIEKVD